MCSSDLYPMDGDDAPMNLVAASAAQNTPNYYDQDNFYPADGGEGIHADVVYEREKFPEDVTEKMIELHCAPATRAHMLNFVQAIESGAKPVADIGEGHISTASCILANLSMQLGRPLVYDPVKREVKEDAQATALLRRPYRSPWKHPEPDNV